MIIICLFTEDKSTKIALLLNNKTDKQVKRLTKRYSLSLYFEKGRQNKTKFKTEQVKNNVNKAAFNIFFSSSFFFFTLSARTSCSIVFISSLT